MAARPWDINDQGSVHSANVLIGMTNLNYNYHSHFYTNNSTTKIYWKKIRKIQRSVLLFIVAAFDTVC